MVIPFQRCEGCKTIAEQCSVSVDNLKCQGGSSQQGFCLATSSDVAFGRAASQRRAEAASVVPGALSTAICSGLPVPRGTAHSLAMGSKSRETIYGASVRAAAERATEARKQADRTPSRAWNKRMLGFQGPAQPSPALGDAINAGFGYLEVKCLGCNTHRTVVLDIVRRPKSTRRSTELERCTVQGLLTASWATVQAQPSGGAAYDQDHGERSDLDMVAGRALGTKEVVN